MNRTNQLTSDRKCINCGLNNIMVAWAEGKHAAVCPYINRAPKGSN